MQKSASVLTRLASTRGEWIADIAVGAAADRVVVDNVALSVDAADARAGTGALEVDAGHRERTVTRKIQLTRLICPVNIYKIVNF